MIIMKFIPIRINSLYYSLITHQISIFKHENGDIVYFKDIRHLFLRKLFLLSLFENVCNSTVVVGFFFFMVI